MNSFGLIGHRERVAVVWPDDESRDAVVQALSTFHYKDVLHYANLTQFRDAEAKTEVQWIITGTFGTDELTLVDYLEEIRSSQNNPAVKVSLLVNKPDDHVFLSRAFALGILSVHAAKFAHMDLLTEFGELNQTILKYKGVLPLVAAHYARTFLNETGKYISRLKMEQTLAKQIPFHPDILFHLAEVEFVYGKRREAVTHLRQAALLAPEYGTMAEAMQSKFLSKDEIADISRDLNRSNILGIKSVMIVDHDTIVTNLLSHIIRSVGIKTVIIFDNGADAVDWLKERGAVDLLISEWKLSGKVSGPALVQRVRQLGLGAMKIMVSSSLLRTADEPLLTELGVDAVLPKPFTQNRVLESLVAIRLAERINSPSSTLIRRIHALCSSGNVKLARNTIEELLAMSDVEESQKKEMEALWAYHNQQYDLCVTLISEALALGNNEPTSYSMMGRALLKLRDFKSAAMFFERAQLTSPQSIQRLIELSEAHLALENLDEARQALHKATSIDPTNEWVVVAESRIAIEQGDTLSARNLLTSLNSGVEIASQMNNRAVALAQSGRIEESIDIYVKTLDALPDFWKSQVTKVTYNLGLAHARNGNYEKAEQVLLSIRGIDTDKMVGKATNLGERIKTARIKGQTIKFTNHDLEMTTTKDSNQSIFVFRNAINKSMTKNISAVTVFRPGDICLYKIFTDFDDPEATSSSSLASPALQPSGRPPRSA